MRFQREVKASKKGSKSGSRVFLLVDVVLWVMTLFFVVGGLTYFPHFASIFMFLAALVIAPIRKWQAIIHRAMPKRWMKPALAVALFAVAVYTVPAPISESAPLDSGISAAVEDGTVLTQPSQSEQDEEVTSTGVDDGLNLLEQAGQTDSVSVQSAPSDSQDEPSTTLSDDSTFEIHFIDVGQADAALVLCDGESMLIDGGNKADSSLIYPISKINP
jgi:competence protein ComEC